MRSRCRLLPRLGHSTRALALACGTIALGCGPERTPPARPAPAGAPVELRALMRRAHFGFRREGAALAGGHSSYASRVEPDGTLELTTVAGGERARVALHTESIGRCDDATPPAERARAACTGDTAGRAAPALALGGD